MGLSPSRAKDRPGNNPAEGGSAGESSAKNPEAQIGPRHYVLQGVDIGAGTPGHFLTQESSEAFALVIPSFPRCLSVVKGTKVSTVLSTPRQVTMPGPPYR
jgi:hypothetical protein